MRLTELEPRWVSHGGEGVTHNDNPVPERQRIGVGFECPCGCEERVFVHIENPVDGLGPLHGSQPTWRRTGETFEDLTLHPSILRAHPGSCKWHGWVKNGEVITC